MNLLQKNFSKIYSKNLWGNKGEEFMNKRKNTKFYSGGGTDPDNDRDNRYINLVQEFISRPDVHTVVEVGCGDWEVSSRIDWNGVQYTAYDVVQELIDYNQSKFGKENINFVCSDIMQKNNVTADLLIVKDVFQHLPSSFCKKFIWFIPDRFKYNIITNDYGTNNADIPFGGWQGNDFTLPPFSMKCELLIHWDQKFKEAGIKHTVSILKP